MRGDAAPSNGAGEAESVQVGGVVVGDACGEERAFPLDGGGLEAFELGEGVEDAFFAGELRLDSVQGREVLPTQEPTEIDGGGDGLDLLAEYAEGEAVDALEKAAVAPFDVVIGVWDGGVGRGMLEGAAEDEPLHLDGEEGVVDGAGIEMEEAGDIDGTGGAEDL